MLFVSFNPSSFWLILTPLMKAREQSRTEHYRWLQANWQVCGLALVSLWWCWFRAIYLMCLGLSFCICKRDDSNEYLPNRVVERLTVCDLELAAVQVCCYRWSFYWNQKFGVGGLDHSVRCSLLYDILYWDKDSGVRPETQPLSEEWGRGNLMACWWFRNEDQYQLQFLAPRWVLEKFFPILVCFVFGPSW